MDPARIAELLQPFLCSAITQATCHSDERSDEESVVLSPSQLQHISTYIDILLRWNARINLTGIRDPEEIVTRHFGESLFAARHLFPATAHVGTAAQACPERSRRGCPAERSLAPAVASRGSVPADTHAPSETNDQRPATNGRITLADVGSGAGFPGLPIKLWAPRISLTLIESNQKKSTFLREVTRALTLTDIDIQTTRAETLNRTFDVVTLRAVERFEAILPTAANLVAPTGRLALLIGTSQLAQAHSLPTFTWQPTLPVPHSSSRILLIGTCQP